VLEYGNLFTDAEMNDGSTFIAGNLSVNSFNIVKSEDTV
jgi:hypothetical protein